MTIVHFTIPIKYSQEDHPIEASATPDDWFDVEVPDTSIAPQADARHFVNQVYGNDGWCSTYTDGASWEDAKRGYYPGRCVAVLTLAPDTDKE